MKIRIIPYKMGSESARLLAEAITERAGYVCHRSKEPRPNRINVVWGNTTGVAANKLRTFQAFQQAGVSCPEFTTDQSVAQRWLRDGPIVVRSRLNGMAGAGATVVEKGSTALANAPLYVKYIPKLQEFRVHVVAGEVIHVSEKRMRSKEVREREGITVDTKIRSHERGWVFCDNDITEPADLREVAIAAANAANNGWGGVDIIYNAKAKKCYALEVNSAPGLTAAHAMIYADKLLEMADGNLS